MKYTERFTAALRAGGNEAVCPSCGHRLGEHLIHRPHYCASPVVSWPPRTVDTRFGTVVTLYGHNLNPCACIGFGAEEVIA